VHAYRAANPRGCSQPCLAEEKSTAKDGSQTEV
jgi:hypothetical protein